MAAYVFDALGGTYSYSGFQSGRARALQIRPVTGTYLLDGYTARIFKSSFSYGDTEIIYVPSEINSATVPGEYRIVALSKDYSLEELFEEREAEAGPRLRVIN